MMAYAMEQVALLGPDNEAELDLIVLGDDPADAEEPDEQAEEELEPRDERVLCWAREWVDMRGAWASLAEVR